MNIAGKELKITPASFDEAMDLKDAIEIAIREGKISLSGELLEGDVFKKELASEDLTGVLNAILSIDSSKAIRNCLFICAERAVLGTDKINRDFFDDVNNRQYYYPIMFEVLRVNLTPFFAKVFSSFTGIGEKIENFLKSK